MSRFPLFEMNARIIKDPKQMPAISYTIIVQCNREDPQSYAPINAKHAEFTMRRRKKERKKKRNKK